MKAFLSIQNWKKSIFQNLEIPVGKCLQWGIYLLHLIELNFRHLMLPINGESTGPESFSGPLSKQILAGATQFVVRFQLINCNVPIVTVKNPNDFSKKKISKYVVQCDRTLVLGILLSVIECWFLITDG